MITVATTQEASAVRVLVSPSYGSPETRRHWADTVDREIPFAELPYAATLLPEERQALLALHPEGRARFWGARPRHDRKMADVRTGDIVLFTGQNRVRAVGEVGAMFRNRAFADLLWPPQPGESGWHTVYSLLDLVPSDITYAQLNAALEYRPRHNFPGQMVVRGAKAQSVLDECLITPGSRLEAAVDDSRVREAVRIAATEERRTHAAVYERTRGLVVAERRESELVAEFRRHLIAQGRTPARFYCPAGVSDIYVADEAEDAELIEAKSKSTHHHVRQALGQLLDYARYSPRPLRRLSGLFPVLPSHDDIGLLHRYGIDVLHRDGPGSFRRLPADEATRNLMRRLWS
jgi:hypothetical protein